MPVSEITQTSAPSSARFWSRNGSRWRLPDSSSPSSTTVTGTGMEPVASFQARKASMKVISWPLSSTAPLATTRLPRGPSTIVGSKGGLSQRSKGSAGWTS